jgi:dTDP-4-dehydrorhamnose reductase
MRVLVVGASGFVGNVLYKLFLRDGEAYGSYHSSPVEGLVKLDMTDAAAVQDMIGAIRPDVIIHPAANPNVEFCEEHAEETRRINVEGSRNIINAARDVGAKYVFFSSDYVFDGINGPYAEDDTPNPVSEYGKQKLEVEKIIQSTLTDYLIIRITVVYGWERHGKNFVMGLIKNLSGGKTMKVPCDQVGSPTYVNNMAQVVKELIEKGKTGIYHVAGSDIMDRYTFALKAAEIFDLDKDLLIPVKTAELGQKAKRPLQAGMRLEKVRQAVNTHIMGVEEGLREMKNNPV